MYLFSFSVDPVSQNVSLSVCMFHYLWNLQGFFIRLLAVTCKYKISRLPFSSRILFWAIFCPFLPIFDFWCSFFLENCLFLSHQIINRYSFDILTVTRLKNDIGILSFRYNVRNILLFNFFFTVMVTSQEKVFDVILDVFWGKFPLFLEKYSIFYHERLHRYSCITLVTIKQKSCIVSSPWDHFCFSVSLLVSVHVVSNSIFCHDVLRNTSWHYFYGLWTKNIWLYL